MYFYIKGIITEITPNYIVLDNNGVGFLIVVSNPYSYQKEETTVYIYQVVREDGIFLYGFKTNDEREMFIKLISVKGIGPKSALSILASGSVAAVSQAIENTDIAYLMKFPGIGQKASQQIILDLKGKLSFDSNDMELANLSEALEALGYSKKEISRIIPKLDKSQPLDVLIKEALKLMLK